MIETLKAADPQLVTALALFCLLSASMVGGLLRFVFLALLVARLARTAVSIAMLGSMAGLAGKLLL